MFAFSSSKTESISSYQFGLALLVFKDTLNHYSYEDAHDHVVFINKTGKIIFDATKKGYLNATAFDVFGYSIVKDKITKKYGVINQFFTTVLPAQFDEINIIGTNRFKISKNDKYGIIDSTNKTIVEFVFGRMEAFTADKKMFCFKDDNWGIYDSTGKLIHKYDCDELIYTEGLVMLDRINKKNYAEYALADTAGKIIVPFKRYSDCSSFSNGLAMVYNENTVSYKSNKNYKKLAGFIDVTGKEIIPLQFEDGLSFYQGLASVKKNGKWGCINTNGKVIIDFLYDEAVIFEDGYAIATLHGNEFYIDTTGKKLSF
ncbi:KWG leptospira [mine drainage metagenome]|uniref:KWG leptospira n=1 Tax=mine drainage metagenome TaxID=410659 RepID=A0A1J5T473_9ZZZZ